MTRCLVGCALAGVKQPSELQAYRGSAWPRDAGGLVLAQEIHQKRDCDYLLHTLFTHDARSFLNMYFE